MLKARLYEYEIQKREAQEQKKMSTKTDIGWGHQIRSYVLQPYQLVKDLRSKIESTNPEDVLDGNLDQFIEGNLFKS
jgi:peptide chain release factor 2